MEQEKQPEELTWWKAVLALVVLVGVSTLIWKSIDFSDSVVETTEVVTSRCLSVPDVIAQRLNDGLNIKGGGSIRNLQAVKSNDFASIYFISGDLQGSGLEGEGDIATFVTNKMDETGLTLSVDAVATEFSDWPDVATTNLGVSMGGDGYNESRNCVTSI